MLCDGRTLYRVWLGEVLFQRVQLLAGNTMPEYLSLRGSVFLLDGILLPALV